MQLRRSSKYLLGNTRLSIAYSESKCLMFSVSFICVQDLINQGRQKVIEATNALKSLSRESLEDTIARVVSVKTSATQLLNQSPVSEDGLNNLFVKRSAINEVIALSFDCNMMHVELS